MNIKIISYEGEKPNKFNPSSLQYLWNVLTQEGKEFTFYATERTHEMLEMAKENTSGYVALSLKSFTTEDGQSRTAYNVDLPKEGGEVAAKANPTPSQRIIPTETHVNKDALIIRQTCIKAAAEFMSVKEDKTEKDVVAAALVFENWILQANSDLPF